jgi:SAM-dependent methyltransferase
MNKYKLKNSCRVCGSTDLQKFLDLGQTHLADRFLIDEQDMANDLKFPLAVNVCASCGWHQLTVVVDESLMYVENYPYDSRTTETGQKHWAELTEKAISLFKGIKNEIKVLDIGSNTGALLSEFKIKGCKVLGIDPSIDASRIAKTFGIENIVDFFGETSVDKLIDSNFYPDIVTSTNSFAHTDDLNRWLSLVERILSPNGVLIIEAPHVLNLFAFNQFDTIYHEHLSYVSLTPLIEFFRTHNLTIFDVEEVDIHGGSLRIFAGKNQKVVNKSVARIASKERELCISDLDFLLNFAKSVDKNREILIDFLAKLVDSGKTIGILSAPAKGMTYFSYCGLSQFKILGISDKNPLKINKFAPGTGLRVIPDAELIAIAPDYLLILAWNFKNEIISNMVKLGYRNKFIVGVPNLEVIDAQS